MNAMNQGKSAAEQSKFTREFIDEKSKTEDGFYKFTSKIDQYTMLFPEKFHINNSPSSYEVHKNYMELWNATTDKSVSKDYVNTLQILYYNDEKINDEKAKETLRDVAYNQQIIKKEFSDKLIYTAATNTDFEINEKRKDPQKNGPNMIAAFIIDKNSNRTIKIDYSTVCFEGKKCSYDYSDQMNFVEKLAQSIKFSQK